MYKSLLSILLSGAVIIAATSDVTASEPISWNINGGDKGAANSLTGGFITLSSDPKDMRSGAQFLYTINKGVTTGLSEVILQDTATGGSSYPLQSLFDMVNQKCSCYWIDAVDLSQRFPSIKSSSKYVIRMSANGKNYDSGLIGLKFSPTVVVTTTSSTTSTSTATATDTGSGSNPTNTNLGKIGASNNDGTTNNFNGPMFLMVMAFFFF